MPLVAVPAVVVAGKALAKTALVCIVSGAVTGSAIRTATEVVPVVIHQENVNGLSGGELAREAAEGAKEGAILGIPFCGAASIVGPVVGKSLGVARQAVSGVADDALRMFGKTITPAIDDAGSAVIKTVKSAANEVAGLAGDAANTVANSARAAADEVAGIADDAVRGVNRFFGRIKGLFNAKNYRNLKPATGTDGYVYAIKDPVTGLTKIGITKNPARRIQELRRVHGEGLEYVSIQLSKNPRAAEAVLHSRYAAQNVSHAGGREWFSLNSRQQAILLPN